MAAIGAWKILKVRVGHADHQLGLDHLKKSLFLERPLHLAGLHQRLEAITVPQGSLAFAKAATFDREGMDGNPPR